MVLKFELTEELKLLRDAIRDFAIKELKPLAPELDRAETGTTYKVLRDLFKKAGKLDYTSLVVPEPLGGQGYLSLGAAVCLEEMAAVCGGLASMFGAHWLGQSPIVATADIEIMERWLKPVAEAEKRGEPQIWALAITEPDVGSDAEYLEEWKPTLPRLNVVARREGDEYVINGIKRFISNAPIADFITVFATIDIKRGVEAWTCFVVPTDSEGFSIGVVEDKMGQRADPVSEIILADVRVPMKNRIGDEGMGWLLTQYTLAYSRGPVGAIALGIARGAYEKALKYASERIQGGKPVIRHQAIKLKLADMFIKIRAARMLIYDACARAEAEYPPPLIEPSMAKTFASDVAVEVAIEAIQIMGGDGYMKDFGVEKDLRDAKLTQIYEGTNEINRLTMADEIIKRRLIA
ncbi:MAG: acyl-CoA dehydrogenase family protein [Candidatus Bathyarchaeota archaeon]|nr:acyl-CoA dehydrogenase family protein [Candidatus Bathyarchaeota archaeon]